MIVERVRGLYEADARRKPGTGWPTGSRAGTCTAQLQMLRFPKVTHPEPPLARNVMTWDEGNRTEEWIAGLLDKAYPGLMGLRQEPFYFEIPLASEDDLKALQERIQRRAIWGRVFDGFAPPTIKVENGKVRLRLLAKDNDGRPARYGFVLDLARRSVWAPTYVDFVIPLLKEDRVVIVEAKSMSNFAFRRALMGSPDYQKRAQLSTYVAATGADVALVAYRKETAHLCEVFYRRGSAERRARIEITRLNGKQDVFWAQPGNLDTAFDEGGAPVELPGDAEWEMAHVQSPFDPGIIDAVRARVLRVLLAEEGRWHREYGPSFVCGRCGGTGMQTMAKGGREPLKKAKPCEDCDATGRLAETELSYPCSYCPCIGHCYPMAKLTIDTKPHYTIKRDEWEAAGLSFTSPETA